MGQAKTKKTKEHSQTTEETAAAPKAPTLQEARDLLARMNPEDRVALMDELLSELPVDPDIEEAQLEEAQRRLDELESGQARAVPHDEMMQKIRRAYEQKRAALNA